MEMVDVTLGLLSSSLAKLVTEQALRLDQVLVSSFRVHLAWSKSSVFLTV